MYIRTSSGPEKIRFQNATHFLSFEVVGWMDLFTKKVYKDILVESLEFCRLNKGLILHAWTILSDRLLLVARAKPSTALSDIIRDFKRHTHRRMIAIIESEAENRRLWMLHQLKYYASRHSRCDLYQIWIHASYPELLTDPGMIAEKINFLHQQPVVAGYVAKPEHYLYSSAVNYAGLPGLIDIDIFS